MRLIYVGSHIEVTTAGIVSQRGGDPQDFPDEIARGLVARGDYVEFVPEPKRPVTTRTPRKK